MALCGEAIDEVDVLISGGEAGPNVNFFLETLRLWDGANDAAVARSTGAVRRVAARGDHPGGHAVTLVQAGMLVGSGLYAPALPLVAIGGGNAGGWRAGSTRSRSTTMR